jgi:hypothetical protein
MNGNEELAAMLARPRVELFTLPADSPLLTMPPDKVELRMAAGGKEMVAVLDAVPIEWSEARASAIDYFRNERHETLRAVAARFGISAVRVQQILHKRAGTLRAESRDLLPILGAIACPVEADPC